MKEIRKDIEQLKEVAGQLEKATPTSARIALLLLDNLVELLMYKKIRLEFMSDSEYGRIIPPKYSSKKRKDVIEYFNEKVNFLITEIRNINEDEGAVIKCAHFFRNEAYHNGVLKEPVILNITRTYFEAACHLFPRLWIKAYSYSSDADVKSFLSEFDIQEAGITTENLSKVCERILTGNKCSTEELCIRLSQYLVQRIDESLEHLNFLASNSMRKETVDVILRRMQFVEMLAKFDFPYTDEGFQQLIKTQNELWPTYKPQITTKRFERWKERALLLNKEKMPGAALKKFLNLEKEYLPIERKIEDSVFKFEEMIDAMIHDHEH
ncbi:MAG: hypothetical protein HZB33_14380 [Nitrospirae bacterium]|nr:hypothetical protein [Nitrospirota bacterium]